MKKISLFVGIIVFAVLAFVLLSVAVPTEEVAYADGIISMTSATQIDENGDEVSFYFSLGEYGRGIKFNFTSTAYAYSYRLFKKSSGVYSEVKSEYGVVIQNEAFSIAVSASGELKLQVDAENEFGMSQETYTAEFKSDNIAPFEPNVDKTELASYHISAFNLDYSLNVDNDSGIDFTRSYYKIDSLTGESLVGNTYIVAGTAAYGTKSIGGINAKCKITFVLYDYAGNHAEYVYYNENYGIEYGIEPQIIVSPETDYASSVQVTIDWGEDYNNNPYAKKYYAVASLTQNPVKTKYDGAFTVKEEGSKIIAYYYDENELEKTITKEIDNVDSTPPSASLLEERFSVSIDLTTSPALQVKVYALDYGSGIGKVYDNYGNEYTALGEGYYGFGYTEYTTFNIVAEDLVGNKASYGYSYPGIDFATMQTYYDKFVALKASKYSTSGWNNVLSAYSALSLYLLDGSAGSSGIAQRAEAIDNAINAGVVTATRYSGVPDGLTEFILLSDASNTNLLIGDVMRLYVGKIMRTDAEVERIYANAQKLADIESAKCYAYTIDLTSDDVEEVVNNGSIVYSFKVTSGFKDIRVFYINEDDELEEIAVTTDGNTVSAYSLYTGEYIVVTKVESTTTESYPLWKAILIAAAIIIAVAVVIFFIVYFITKRRR